MNTENLNFSKDLMAWYSDHLLAWFYHSKRDLPFRASKNPYAIWISEIMAQQTQIDTLIPYYKRFIQTFPDVDTLAQADEADVLKLWEGLGYYSRAKNLHKAAQIIVNDYNSVFPSSYKELIALPGIGPYTGGAIASIAFNEKVSAVDGNVLRVISRFNNFHGDIADTKTKKVITQWVEMALPDQPGDFNEALMELGALICTPTSPKCMICPVRANCLALQYGTVDLLPIKSKKIKQKSLQMEVGILINGNKLYFVKRPQKGLLANLWGFPIIECQSKNPDGSTITQLLKQRFPTLPEGKLIGAERHVFSHIIWNMNVYLFQITPEIASETASSSYNGDNEVFKSLDDLESIALPVAFSKLLCLL